MNLSLRVNGREYAVDVPPMKRLLDVLREDLRLTGTKEGCGEGECGACSVLLDGELVNSCLVPAVQADGAEISTVEGLSEKGALSPLQRSFLKHNAAQCGVCSPGMLVAARWFLDGEGRLPGESAREALAGNICRCTGYAAILDAVSEQEKPARRARRPAKPKPMPKKPARRSTRRAVAARQARKPATARRSVNATSRKSRRSR